MHPKEIFDEFEVLVNRYPDYTPLDVCHFLQIAANFSTTEPMLRSRNPCNLDYTWFATFKGAVLLILNVFSDSIEVISRIHTVNRSPVIKTEI